MTSTIVGSQLPEPVSGATSDSFCIWCSKLRLQAALHTDGIARFINTQRKPSCALPIQDAASYLIMVTKRSGNRSLSGSRLYLTSHVHTGQEEHKLTDPVDQTGFTYRLNCRVHFPRYRRLHELPRIVMSFLSHFSRRLMSTSRPFITACCPS